MTAMTSFFIVDLPKGDGHCYGEPRNMQLIRATRGRGAAARGAREAGKPERGKIVTRRASEGKVRAEQAR